MVGKERLAERLDTLGLKQVVMQDDGNCQFRAFSHQLYGTEEHHATIRSTVVMHMYENRAAYSMYFDGEEAQDRYLAHMARDAEWGDELTLKAFGEQYQIVVHVIVSTGKHWYNKYEPAVARDHGAECIVSYLSPVHYNSVVPKDDP